MECSRNQSKEDISKEGMLNSSDVRAVKWPQGGTMRACEDFGVIDHDFRARGSELKREKTGSVNIDNFLTS